MRTELQAALRSLRRAPGFVLASVLTLGLGIGATTAIFSVVDGVLLQPLPYADPDRLVLVLENGQQGVVRLPSYPAFEDYRSQTSAFTGFGYAIGSAVGLRTEAGVVQLVSARVSDGYFDVLGATPLLGRLLGPEDEVAGAPPVGVLTYGFWRARFGGDPAVIGRTLTTDEGSLTVVGVLPPGAVYPSWVQVYSPLAVGSEPVARYRRDVHVDGGMIARIAPGVPIATANAELARVSARLAEAYPEGNTGFRAGVVPLVSQVVGPGARTPLLLLLAATGMVLLIACVNVANLSLARVAGRTHELALRSTLGAGRRRLILQLLIETLLLSLAGTVLGLGLAWGLTDALTATGDGNLLAAGVGGVIPRLEELHLDGRAIAAALGLTLLTGLATGLVPAWRGSRTDLAAVLKQGGPRGGAGPGARLGRRALIALQAGLALTLLIGAGLLLNSFWRLTRVDRGFQGEGLLTVHLFPSPRYAGPASDIASLWRRVAETAAEVPGVASVGLVNHLAMAGSWSGSRVAVDGAPVSEGQDLTVGIRTVNQAYLENMRIPLLRGRWFNPADMRATFAGGVVINQTLATQYWPGQDPLGHRIAFYKSAAGRADFGQPLSAEVVGVVGDVKQFGLGVPSDAAIYLPYPVNPWGHITLTLRSTRDPAALAEPVRRALVAAEPDLVISEVRTMEEVVSGSLVGREFVLLLVGLFAAAALGLAAIGLYGVLSHLVRQREREIGIRTAIGADRRQILGLVLRDGLGAVLAGVLVGLLAAWGLGSLLASQLYGVRPVDPLTWGVTVLLLLGVAWAACYLPARRAARVDPIVALRSD